MPKSSKPPTSSAGKKAAADELSKKEAMSMEFCSDSQGVRAEIEQLEKIAVFFEKQLTDKKISQEERQIARDRFKKVMAQRRLLLEKESHRAAYSKLQQMNIRLLPLDIKKLEEVREYWSINPSKNLNFLGFEATSDDLKSNISLSRFVLKSAIHALASDAYNQMRIDELLSHFADNHLHIDMDDWDLEIAKEESASWARNEWGSQEYQMLFELLWPIAVEKAKAIGTNSPEDAELIYRKKQLQALNGGSIDLH